MDTKPYESALVNEAYTDYLQQIGRITVNFGMLEFFLLFIFNHLLIRDLSKSMIVFYSMDTRPRLDLMNALGNYQWKDQPETLAEFKDLMHKVGDATKERNSVFHCTWGANPRDPSYVTRQNIKTKSGTHSHKDTKETINSLRAKAKKIGHANMSMMQFMQKANILPS